MKIKYLISYGYLFGLILILTITSSVLCYFTNLDIKIFKIIIPIISLLIGGIALGRNTKEKAYLEGIKYTVPYILFCVIWMIIFGYKFNLGVMVLSLIYLLSGIIGTIIGINLKKN